MRKETCVLHKMRRIGKSIGIIRSYQKSYAVLLHRMCFLKVDFANGIIEKYTPVGLYDNLKRELVWLYIMRQARNSASEPLSYTQIVSQHTVEKTQRLLQFIHIQDKSFNVSDVKLILPVPIQMQHAIEYVNIMHKMCMNANYIERLHKQSFMRDGHTIEYESVDASDHIHYTIENKLKPALYPTDNFVYSVQNTAIKNKRFNVWNTENTNRRDESFYEWNGSRGNAGNLFDYLWETKLHSFYNLITKINREVNQDLNVAYRRIRNIYRNVSHEQNIDIHAEDFMINGTRQEGAVSGKPVNLVYHLSEPGEYRRSERDIRIPAHPISDTIENIKREWEQKEKAILHDRQQISSLTKTVEQQKKKIDELTVQQKQVQERASFEQVDTENDMEISSFFAEWRLEKMRYGIE